jgi:hypothetical protein
MKYQKYIYFVGAILLFLLILTSKSDSYFRHGDENGYLYNLVLIEKYGWSKDFFAHYRGMAGPLHSMVHWLLKPLTGGIPPFVRLPNFVFLLAILLIIRDLCKKSSLEIFAIPMTFVCVGFAMTELPAMFFLMLSIWLLKRVGEERDWVTTVKMALAGICFSLAILGRMNFLAMLPVFSLWIFLKLGNWDEKVKNWQVKNWKNFSKLFFNLESNYVKLFSNLLIFNVLSLSSIWFLYQVWGGITSPETQIYAKTVETKSWAIDHFILALCFAFMMSLMIAPTWFGNIFSLIKRNLKVFFFLFLIIMVGNLFLNAINFLPAKSVFYRFTNENQQAILATIFGSFTILVALLFLFQLFLKIKENWKSADYIFYGFSALAILFTCIKMTHLFSARYPFLAIPFLILMIKKEEEKESWWKILLAIGGIAFGVLTWFSYQTIYPD